MAVILAVANQKGGVGKTITAVTLAHGLARRGANVLLIDLDPQGNVADSLGMDAAPCLYNLITQAADLRECADLGRDGLYVVRGDKTTAKLKNYLAGQEFSVYVIQDMLNSRWLDDAEIHAVILDCAPSLDILHTAALMAADYLLVPARLDQFAIKGVMEISSTLSGVRRRGSRCSLAGIIPTFYDRQTRETQIQLENLAQQFGVLVWPPVPQDTSVRLANRFGVTLWEMRSRPRAMDGYDRALERLEALL